MNNLKQIMEGPNGLKARESMLTQQVIKKEEHYQKAKDNNKDQKAQLNHEKSQLEESSAFKITKRRQNEQDFRVKADKIREEAKDDHDKRVTELNATILQLKQTLHNNLEAHTKEEAHLAAGWENAENNYQSNLDSYDQEMNSISEKICQAQKEADEYNS